jgi:hypothetical protein
MVEAGRQRCNGFRLTVYAVAFAVRLARTRPISEKNRGAAQYEISVEARSLRARGASVTRFNEMIRAQVTGHCRVPSGFAEARRQ